MKIECNGRFWKFLSICDRNEIRLLDAANGWGMPLDVCTVRWMCVKAAAKYTMMFLVGMFASAAAMFVLGDFAAWIMALMMFGWVNPEAGALGLVTVLLAVGVLIGITALFSLGTNTVKESHVGEMYRSWRDKYCEKVEIV